MNLSPRQQRDQKIRDLYDETKELGSSAAKKLLAEKFNLSVRRVQEIIQNDKGLKALVSPNQSYQMSNDIEDNFLEIDLIDGKPPKEFFENFTDKVEPQIVNFTAETSEDFEIKPTTDFVKGTSTLYDEAGNVKLKWVKTDNKKDFEYAREWIEALKEDLPVILPVENKQKSFRDDILIGIPFGDPHLGMHAWAEETGADFDIKIAERDLCGAVDRLLSSTPPSAECLIANLGDFFHADNMDAQTWRSKHSLDVDSRWAKVLRVGVKVMRYCIEAAARRHKKVTVINAIGNHDDHSSMFLTVALSHIYENDERINIIDNPTSLHFYKFGKVLIAVTHGHEIKMANLPLVTATERPKEWGETTHRYGWTGHIHHDSKKEFNGMVVESFRTLASRDAWAASKGYKSGRDMKSMVIHKEYGEIERHCVSVEMLNG